ncbi:hypothetical protein CDL15_Pgr019635 [Punica granatum]|uniref:Uncharacterized protein n=1 Tax=Punica granatum TaxID=22663 RepID=A0A218X539_PUNGR|nr:hypothetical protein CDL15_Pgr019635 [Punica granatum]PKI52933.1 hypothetical protein CRG98_026764 [Punica granatum]
MKVGFTAKPHCLTLTSGAALSPAKLRLLLREFLGNSHKLRRPGGLRSRRKCRKLSLLQLQSPPSLLVRSSFGPNSALVVVVAVVTLSAISVYYFNRYARKMKNAKQVGNRSFIQQCAPRCFFRSRCSSCPSHRSSW